MSSTATFTLLALAGAAFGQAARPTFEVASVKPALNPRELRARGQRPTADTSDDARLQWYGTMSGLIRTAYSLKPYEKLIAPEWIDTTFFEISAKLPDGATRDQVPARLQDLLADRFKLAVRRDPKEQTVYLLNVAKEGPRLKVVAPDAPPKP